MQIVYTEEVIQMVWEKGMCIEDNDSNIWRKDECGAWIQRSMHSDRTSQYGWEIDLINPHGPEEISNLRPIHWKNSVGKGTGKLLCRITANGIDNKEVVTEVESWPRKTK
jgi:Tfp pilus assembly protein PilX